MSWNWRQPGEPYEPPPAYEVSGAQRGECPTFVIVSDYRWSATRMGRPMPRPGQTGLWKRPDESEQEFNARVLSVVAERKARLLQMNPLPMDATPIPVRCCYEALTEKEWRVQHRVEMLIEKGRDPRRSHKHRVASLCRAADLLGMTTPESNAPAFASEEQMNAFREFLRERRTVN